MKKSLTLFIDYLTFSLVSWFRLLVSLMVFIVIVYLVFIIIYYIVNFRML